MTKLQLLLYELVPWLELLAAIVGILYYKKLKDTYWKWFIYYLVAIFVMEAYSKWGLESHPYWRRYYYNYLVIPFEFVFFYWLYAVKSLARKRLFWTSVIIYACFHLLSNFVMQNNEILNSLSYTVSVLLLAIMAFFEFQKQVKSDSILQFQENKMFYINVGIILFYVGTLPFFTFDRYLYNHMPEIWSSYRTLFLFAVNVLSLLFIASFIWGKPKP
jgi:hypothetical protein